MITTPLDANRIQWMAPASRRQHLFPLICGACGYMPMNPYADGTARNPEGCKRVPWPDPGAGREACGDLAGNGPARRAKRPRPAPVCAARSAFLREERYRVRRAFGRSWLGSVQPQHFGKKASAEQIDKVRCGRTKPVAEEETEERCSLRHKWAGGAKQHRKHLELM